MCNATYRLTPNGGSCQRCIKSCPAGAISQKGHDKKRCQFFLFNEQKKLLKELGRENEGYIGRYLACGLCQAKVPCESRIPLDISAKMSNFVDIKLVYYEFTLIFLYFLG